MSRDIRARAAVFLGEQRVGSLEQRGQASRFVPSESWAEMPAGARPVLGQQFEEDPYCAHSSRFGAPVWFEHLLPEVGGPLRVAIARSLSLSTTDSFGLLMALGRDLPGAVRVVPIEAEDELITVARREQGSRSRGTGHPEPSPLRVSLAGIQFKISARQGKRGIGVPATGEDGDWILKFADQRFPTLAENEYVVMRWASLAGLDVPEVRLIPTAEVEGIEMLASITGATAFGIRRYDRTADGRVHQEDFAQVLGLAPGDAKYQDTNIDTIARILRALTPPDLTEFIRRLVFVVLSGNDDAHAKNWSLWYPNRFAARLTPAYDLVATGEYFPLNHMSLKLAGARKFDVDRTRFRSLARRVGIDEATVDETVVVAVRAQHGAWQEARELDECYGGVRDFIDARMACLRLVRESL